MTFAVTQAPLQLQPQNYGLSRAGTNLTNVVGAPRGFQLTSDDLFLELLGLHRSYQMAAIAWWLLSLGADGSPRRVDPFVASTYWNIAETPRLWAIKQLVDRGFADRLSRERNGYMYRMALPAAVLEGRWSRLARAAAFAATDVLPAQTQWSRAAYRLESPVDLFVLIELVRRGAHNHAIAAAADSINQSTWKAPSNMLVLRSYERLATLGCIHIEQPGPRQAKRISVARAALDSLLQPPDWLSTEAQSQLPGWSIRPIAALQQLDSASTAAAPLLPSSEA